MGDDDPKATAVSMLERREELTKLFGELNEQAQKDLAFRAEAIARPRKLKAPDAAERALLERVRGEIKDYVDLLWDGYSDPELALWRTRYQRKQPPFVDVAAEAAKLRKDAMGGLLQLFDQCGGRVEKAARLGLMLRIQRLASGNASTKNVAGVMGAHDDVISDAELAPIAKIWNARKPGAKRGSGQGKWTMLHELLKKRGDATKPVDLRKEWGAFMKLLEKNGRKLSDVA